MVTLKRSGMPNQSHAISVKPVKKLSATTQRRMAIVMEVTHRTIVRKFLFMAWQASLEHNRVIEA